MKLIKKIIAFWVKLIALSLATYYIILHKIFRLNYKTTSVMISKWTGYFGILLRRYFYENTLQKCGKNLSVFYGAYIVYPEVEIGDRCTIEEYSIISMCTLGDDVIIAARCSLMSGAHHHDVDDLEHIFSESKSNFKRIILGDNLWIGTHAVIMEDVSSHTAIGAGAVVTKNFPPYSILGGVPAKLIRKRGYHE